MQHVTYYHKQKLTIQILPHHDIIESSLVMGSKMSFIIDFLNCTLVATGQIYLQNFVDAIKFHLQHRQ